MLVIGEGVGIGVVGIVIVSPPQDPCVSCLLPLTDIHSPFAAFSLNSRLNSLAILSRNLLGIPSLISVIDTLEGDSTASLYAFSVNTAYFDTFSDNSKALGKSPVLKAPQGNFAVFVSFTGSRRYEVGWWDDLGGLLDLGSKQRGHRRCHKASPN